MFQPGDRVDVTGISKGKGFAGVIKRLETEEVRKHMARCIIEE